MREVRFKNKNAKHRLRVNGKFISFENGTAEVNEAEAKAITAMENDDYKVMPSNPVGVIAEEKPKVRAKKTKTKKKAKK